MTSMKEWCQFGDEVARALAIEAPVVALETTVVTHGLPHPDGVRTALSLEQIVRDAGATPATIGIIGRAIRVGLMPAELEQLATTPNVAKINLSNLAAALSSGQPGSTTVAATMAAADASAIRVFATGGIGGVHRDASESGDISADVTALSRIPVAVVCAGAKAILDLPRTVEMLETLGVPVFGYGTDEFPAFYRRSSGLPVDRRYDSISALAAAVRLHLALGLGTGVVIANPIPIADEMASELYDRALHTALLEAKNQHIRGRAVTPFLLERMRALTGGDSVRANVALLRHNAQVAAEIAVAINSAVHE
jgi:pseudouridine-5'-phosphate glycosidase